MNVTQQNQTSRWLTIVIGAAVVFGIGYFLVQSSPDSQTNSAKTNGSAASSDHHGGAAVAANDATLNALVGKPMPDIQLSDADGGVFAAADYKGKNVVLFFNEGLMCYPACWNQMASFGSDSRFNSDSIQAISVVTDSAKEWQRAVEKMPELAKAATMFDSGANASRRLGLLSTDSSMHRGSLPGHTYIIVDAEGVVRYVLDDPSMGVANDVLYDKITELQK